ncbi:olfactory receptor 10A7-like [Pleurodeles waltl]|uniref:olfactory receptor 10A7-like n=1 Tax=Pleurodeles waltl TaxID=8319 RepID=UPI0037093F66
MICGNQSSLSGFTLLGFLDLNPYLQNSIFVLLLLVYLATLIGNIIIIFLVSVDNSLQTPMYLFLRNLSFLEVCFISTTVPKTLISFRPSNSSISFEACAVQMFLFVSMGITECFFLAVMAYDRHIAICKPLRYKVIISQRVCFILIIVSWMWGAFISAGLTRFIFSLPYCGSNVINHFFCDMPAVLSQASSDTLMNEITLFIANIVAGIFPFTLIIFSYVNILLTVLRMSSTAGRQRAFSTCGSHLFSVTLFYGSTTCMYLRLRPSVSQERDKLLSLLYSVVTPMLNPLIYSLRNKDVKNSLKKLVRKYGFV